jgi:uncharacterized protein (DUF433 family)
MRWGRAVERAEERPAIADDLLRSLPRNQRLDALNTGTHVLDERRQRLLRGARCARCPERSLKRSDLRDLDDPTERLLRNPKRQAGAQAPPDRVEPVHGAPQRLGAVRSLPLQPRKLTEQSREELLHMIERFMKRILINPYIVADPEICHGKPTFKGTRIMVWQALAMLESGAPVDEILAAFPSLTPQHVKAALAYAFTVARLEP